MGLWTGAKNTVESHCLFSLPLASILCSLLFFSLFSLLFLYSPFPLLLSHLACLGMTENKFSPGSG